jgi:hypothetical protein
VPPLSNSRALFKRNGKLEIATPFCNPREVFFATPFQSRALSSKGGWRNCHYFTVTFVHWQKGWQNCRFAIQKGRVGNATPFQSPRALSLKRGVKIATPFLDLRGVSKMPPLSILTRFVQKGWQNCHPFLRTKLGVSNLPPLSSLAALRLKGCQKSHLFLILCALFKSATHFQPCKLCLKGVSKLTPLFLLFKWGVKLPPLSSLARFVQRGVKIATPFCDPRGVSRLPPLSSLARFV